MEDKEDRIGIERMLTPPTVETCRYRRPIPSAAGEEVGECGLLRQLLAGLPEATSQVVRPVCEACCRSFPPSLAVLNPIIAALVYDKLRVANDCSEATPDMQALLRQAERYLHVDDSYQAVADQLKSHSDQAVGTVLRDLLPFPRRRFGTPVQCWAVGVTTSPRRDATLDRCLDSLARAGWARPVLFVDGNIGLSERFRTLPITCRDEPLGAWPNFYLALTELLMREPLADAYLMVQDDALIFDQENVRAYLEEMLWTDSPPGIVSLYWSTPDRKAHFGWRKSTSRWRCGALAIIFPRHIALDLVHDRAVLAHRWSTDGQGLVGIPDVIEDWAKARSISMFYPTPSLVQHIGVTSTIWADGYQLTSARRAGCFAGDVLRGRRDEMERSSSDGQITSDVLTNLRTFRLDAAAATFPEDYFPYPRAVAPKYEARVCRGRNRMRSVSVVICALCRDVMHCLPTTAARIERLAGMFGDCQTVIFENDSRDSTLPWLEQWSAVNAKVHVVSQRLNAPNFRQEVGDERTARMAFYRNQCRETALARFPDYEYAIVLDVDLEGGWSYDGIAHTFGETDWDFVGSNGIWYESDAAGHKLGAIHYDAFAFRRIGCEECEDFPTVNRLAFSRGDPLLQLWSCFGGLGVYRMECFKSAQYHAGDCEHVTFHSSLRLRGYDRLFLNPSQIVVYTPFPAFPAATKKSNEVSQEAKWDRS